MTKNHKEIFLCPICQKQKRSGEIMHGEVVHGPVAEIIQREHPDWTADNFICISCLNQFRAKYVQDVLEVEKGELSALDFEVIESLKKQELLSKNVDLEFEYKLTFGERIADKVADFGGSWKFIIIFGIILTLWIIINSIILIWKPFDPYPFILLNLVLSCIAAMQAPVIMMSQNRQEAKDRLRAEHDYRINLKAELEIRHLHQKIDHLLTHQWQSLLEIQRIQIDLMEEINRQPPRKHNG
ncbi:MAG: DUF1003 domain-containing protein [Armatimonadetes bacterium]|nr:DUF1003 domain-containing protein [Armatimonadota bacterium]